MERLTTRDIDGAPILLHDKGYAALLDRLAAYEDLEEHGRLVELPEPTPDIDFVKIFNLIMADTESRLVVPPCKVGDTVYIIIDGKIYKGEVYHISYSDYYGKVTSAVRAKIDFSTASVGASFEDFGKTAFLTRAAAEAALRKEEDK